MTQVCEKSDYEVKVKDSHQEVSEDVKKGKANSSLGGLNPRYYENARTPKKAKVCRDLKSLTNNALLL